MLHEKICQLHLNAHGHHFLQMLCPLQAFRNQSVLPLPIPAMPPRPYSPYLPKLRAWSERQPRIIAPLSQWSSWQPMQKPQQRSLAREGLLVKLVTSAQDQPAPITGINGQLHSHPLPVSRPEAGSGQLSRSLSQASENLPTSMQHIIP